MRNLLILAIGLLSFSFFCFEAHAKPRKTYSYNSNYVASGDTSTAQGVADIMARNNRIGHWGGNSGYEGCGSGKSPEEAYRNCCFANRGMETVDVGYAQGSNGKWFCCRRYR